MTRRRRIFLAFAAIMISVLLIVVAGVATLTQSEWGTRQVVRIALDRVNNAIQGTMYIGRISGSIFTGMTIDSLEIRDKNDSLFVAIARLEMEYDPRDLLDRRVLMRNVRMARLRANIFEDSTGMFNFRRIFPSGPPGPAQEVPRNAWGQFIKLENVTIDSTAITVTTRWAADSTLPRAQRDSLTTYNLRSEERRVGKERSPGGRAKT